MATDRVAEQDQSAAPDPTATSIELRPELTFFRLDDEMVVFSEATQCVVGFNAPAAFVLNALREGKSPSEVAQTLASEGFASPEEASDWVGRTLEAFQSQGLLVDGEPSAQVQMEAAAGQRLGPSTRFTNMPPYAPFEPVAERRYLLLDTCALVRFASVEQVPWVEAVVGHLATDDGAAPTVVLDIQFSKTPSGHFRSDIYLDGYPIQYVPRLSMLGPAVKGALWSPAVNTYDFFLCIHAGVVGRGERCIVLPAEAGSGKSSLTTALIHNGFRYFSDEAALIDRNFRVAPVPLALCAKSTGWDLMARYYPDISSLLVHGREDGKLVRYLPPPPGAPKQPPVPASHIIFPRFEQDAPTRLTRVTRTEALGRLMGECLALRQRLDQDNIDRLVRWIAGIDCYELIFSSLDEAVELVAQLTDQTP